MLKSQSQLQNENWELKQVQDSFHSLDSFYFFSSLEHWSNFMSEKLVEKQGNGQNLIKTAILRFEIHL